MQFRTRLHNTAAFCVCCLFVAACQGVVSGGAGGGGPPGAMQKGGSGPAVVPSLDCDEPHVAPTQLRRLTRSEFENSVADLFNVSPEAFANARMQADPRPHGFDSTFDEAVTSSYMNALLEASEAASAEVAKHAAQVVGCSLADQFDVMCAKPFLRKTMRLAFRRAVSDEDFDLLWRVFEAERTAGGEATALRAAVEQILQSPEFLYVLDEPGDSGVAKVKGTALATRLALLLWRAVPDDDLLTAAANGSLDNEAGLRKQIERMLDDAKARRGTDDFLRQWLNLDAVKQLRKNVEQAPWFGPQTGSELVEHAAAWFDEMAWAKAGGPKELLTNDLPPLASQMPGALEAAGPRRKGVLMHPAFLAQAARANASAPVKRGIFVLQNLLCTTPAPPADAEAAEPPVPKATLTTRELFEQHVNRPSCAGCHAAFDPFGMALEAYDGLGVWRSHENGKPINTKVRIDIDGTSRSVDGAADLAEALAVSPVVNDCVVTQWFRFAFAREETPADACTLAGMTQALANGGLVALIKATATSDASLYNVKAAP